MFLTGRRQVTVQGGVKEVSVQTTVEEKLDLWGTKYDEKKTNKCGEGRRKVHHLFMSPPQTTSSPDDLSFFTGRETVISSIRHPPLWRGSLPPFLSRQGAPFDPHFIYFTDFWRTGCQCTKIRQRCCYLVLRGPYRLPRIQKNPPHHFSIF